jgi:predicted outer membrane protein
MRTAGLYAWAIAAAVLLPAAVSAQQRPGYAAGSEVKPLSAAQRFERRFLQITAANDRFQAEAAELVLARTGNPAVKELAQAITDRRKALQPELLRLLSVRGMAMPIPTSEHNKVLKQLAKAKGPRQDRMFVDDVVLPAAQADVANFEKVAAQAEDPVLKAWVERQLPSLRFHTAKAGKALPNAALRGQRAV